MKLSISSMKITVFVVFAAIKISRRLVSVSCTHLEPTLPGSTATSLALCALAKAFAMRVFPVPRMCQLLSLMALAITTPVLSRWHTGWSPEEDGPPALLFSCSPKEGRKATRQEETILKCPFGFNLPDNILVPLHASLQVLKFDRDRRGGTASAGCRALTRPSGVCNKSS